MRKNMPDIKDIDISVKRTDTLESNELEMVHQLFDLAYRKANHSYLEKSFLKLKYIALAFYNNVLAGFALAETIKTHLPRMMEPQIVSLAGICCVDSNYRRLGLFKTLEYMAFGGSGILKPQERVLMCGRMAHPVSFRTMRQFPSVIPKYGMRLSEWQKEIALRVAELYGSNIDPETMVVIGDGSPCGYPNINCEVTEEEWLPFKAVNRDRGDTLLGIFWVPDAPEDW
jgi:hypothetical protein